MESVQEERTNLLRTACYRRKCDMDSKNGPSCFTPRPPSEQEDCNREMRFKFKDYHSEAFGTFSMLKENNHFCDVDLLVQNQVFRCHRIILAAASPYFKAMFTNGLMESNMSHVNLQGVDSHSVAVLINFAYTGEIVIKELTICQILPVATMFQMNFVIEACCSFLVKQLDEVNCIGISEFAHQHGCTSLYLEAQGFIYQHFCQVSKEEEFVNLSLPKLLNLIKSEELNVPCESTVYDAVIRWIKHDVHQRIRKIDQILSLVRLHFIPPQYLREQISKCKVIQESPQSREYLEKIFQELLFHKKPSTEPRTSQHLSAVYTVGGYGGRGSHSLNNLELYDSQAMQWFFLAPLPKPRSGLEAVFLLGKFIVIGGRNNNPDDSTDLDAVDSYDPATNTWSSLSPMNVPRNRVGAIVIDQMLYVVGGSYCKNNHNSVERYSLSDNTWKYVQSMHIPRIGAGVAAVNRLMYVIGGYDGVNRTSSVERYHPEKDEWSFVSSMKCARSGAGVVSMNQFIYVIGGFDGQTPLRDVERYNVESNMWEMVKPMRKKRSALHANILNGLIYAFGGYDGVEVLSSVEIYDPETKEWSEAPPMSCARSGHATAVHIAPCFQH